MKKLQENTWGRKLFQPNTVIVGVVGMLVVVVIVMEVAEIAIRAGAGATVQQMTHKIAKHRCFVRSN